MGDLTTSASNSADGMVTSPARSAGRRPRSCTGESNRAGPPRAAAPDREPASQAPPPGWAPRRHRRRRRDAARTRRRRSPQRADAHRRSPGTARSRSPGYPARRGPASLSGSFTGSAGSVRRGGRADRRRAGPRRTGGTARPPPASRVGLFAELDALNRIPARPEDPQLGGSRGCRRSRPESVPAGDWSIHCETAGRIRAAHRHRDRSPGRGSVDDTRTALSSAARVSWVTAS